MLLVVQCTLNIVAYVTDYEHVLDSHRQPKLQRDRKAGRQTDIKSGSQTGRQTDMETIRNIQACTQTADTWNVKAEIGKMPFFLKAGTSSTVKLNIC